MRVLVLGGAGEIGAAACRTLVAMPAVGSVVVADRAGDRAGRLAAELGDGASAVALDVTDAAALAALLADCDVVANMVGPFYRFGVSILAAAIAAGRDYVDICDDPEPTLEMLELDGRARAAGVTALLGMGASPGLANLLAMRAAAELDDVHTAITGWNADAAQSTPIPGREVSAALLHGVRQLRGTIPVRKDGALVQRDALERVVVDYPGIGRIAGRSFGHPEPVTLARGIDGLRESTNAAFGRRSTLAGLRLVRGLVDRAGLSEPGAARLAGRLEQLTPAAPADLLVRGGPPPIFAVLTGRRHGRPATVACALAQLPGFSMAANTGVPFAVALPMAAAAGRPGVHTPETLIDPTELLDALAEHCIGSPRPDLMTATTRSWVTPQENARELAGSLLTAVLAPEVAAA